MDDKNSFTEKERKVCRQLGIKDINELDGEDRALIRALSHVDIAAERGAEEGYMTKEQLAKDLREALTEVYMAKKRRSKTKIIGRVTQ
jgi:predicted nucleotide-binding protein (sugar kinase/HSP70/actin superfamily)